ncbi:elongation factor G [bacterium]|nr:elongation factor G [bacterium]
MKEYSPEAIRNVSFIGHGACGKTMLTEALLFAMKAIDRMGSIDEGTTHSDFTKEEIERKSSIATSLLTAEYKDHKFNLLDTPGFSDFIGEVKGALHVSDFAMTVVHGVSGLEVVTEQVWQFATDDAVPRGFFVNQMDKENANFDAVLEQLENTFGNTAAIHYAVNPGVAFNQVIDVLGQKLLTFEKGGKTTKGDVPADLQDKAAELRETLMERAAEADDDLLEKYFDAGELTQDEILKGLKAGIRNGTLHPVLCGAAVPQFGMQELAQFLIDYAPSPEEMGIETGKVPETGEDVELKPDANAPSAALVFKTTTEAHIGEMSYMRVYSGTIRSGDELANTSAGGMEKINQMYFSQGKERKGVDHVSAGDMGVLVKLKNTHTGDTLCDPAHKVLIEEPHFPEPGIRAAVIAGGGDEDKLGEGLQILQKADPTFNVTFDPELKQTILSGQGDAQFAVILSRLKERFGVQAHLVEPRIPYRETIKTKAEAEGKHKKQSGGRGQFGLAWLRIEPMPRGEGYEFVDEIVGGAIPRQFIPAVDKGVQETMTKGVVAGYPVVDVKVTVFDGKYHTVDSDEFSFKMAGSIGFKEAVKNSKTVILEPVYEVEIKVPQENMGDVMGDISSRRGKVASMDSEGKWQLIKATIPLAELYKYANTLRSLTSGRGMHRRKFSHYEEVPGDIQAKLVEEHEKEKAEG